MATHAHASFPHSAAHLAGEIESATGAQKVNPPNTNGRLNDLTTMLTKLTHHE